MNFVFRLVVLNMRWGADFFYVEKVRKSIYECQVMTKLPAPIKNVTSYRVMYGDTDQRGVVYYANYLRWFERGRSEFRRQVGLPYSSIEEQGFHFPVTKVTCRYSQSARYDDMIQIETELTEVGRASLSFNYRIFRQADKTLG